MDLPFSYLPNGQLKKKTKMNRVANAAQTAATSLLSGKLKDAFTSVKVGMGLTKTQPNHSLVKTKGNPYADVISFSLESDQPIKSPNSSRKYILYAKLIV